MTEKHHTLDQTGDERDEARPDADVHTDEARPPVAAFDPYFSKLFVDDDRVSGAIGDDEELWSGY